MDTLMATAAAVDDVTFLQLVNADRSLITSGVVARREPMMQVGLFDEALRNAQDFDLWSATLFERIAPFLSAQGAAQVSLSPGRINRRRDQ